MELENGNAREQAAGSESNEGLGDTTIYSEFEVEVNGAFVAHTSGPRTEALREALRYASLNAKDGDVQVFELTWTRIA